MTNPNLSQVTVEAPDLVKGRVLSYEAIKLLLPAIKLEDTPNYSFDTVHAAAVAHAASENAAAHKDLLSTLPTFDYKNVPLLDQIGQALMYVQGEIGISAKTQSQLSQHVAEGYPLRNLLLTYSDALVLVNIINPKIVEQIRQGTGQTDLVEDLESLSHLYNQTPGGISGPVTQKHVDRAAELSSLMVQELEAKAEYEERLPALLEERRKIGYLLTKVHHQVHRAMLFIRDEQQDADELVPSLYVAGPGRPSKDKTDQPSTTTATGTTPGTATGTTTDPTPAATTEQATTFPVGHPGSSPFLDGKGPAFLRKARE
jgi:hypothetical protein